MALEFGVGRILASLPLPARVQIEFTPHLGFDLLEAVQGAERLILPSTRDLHHPGRGSHCALSCRPRRVRPVPGQTPRRKGPPPSACDLCRANAARVVKTLSHTEGATDILSVLAPGKRGTPGPTGRASGHIASPREAGRGRRASAPGEGRQGFKHRAGVPCARTLSRRPSVGGLSRCAGEAMTAAAAAEESARSNSRFFRTVVFG
jgi:hypothetical protein